MPLAPAAAGAWSIVTTPNTGTAPTSLSGTTCASASDCWAVGYYFDGSNAHTLIEQWNGTSWSIVISPNTSTTQDNVLNGVTCVSASECWAVGYYNNGSNVQTLIEQWNGTSWAIVTSPNTSTTQDNFLKAVTCASASDCWAVGYYFDGNVFRTLIERWNGTSWSIDTSPNSNAQHNYLNDVTCVSVSECWTVGYSDPGDFLFQTLIERWNGTSWSIVTSPNTSTTDANNLNGVTCVSASDCWAVGEYYVSNVNHHTLTERWNGTSWAIISSPNTSTTEDNFLNGVTCASASDCWAVGYYDHSVGGHYVFVHQTLVERWNGTSWAVVTSPSTSTTQDNRLVGVMCASASDCWAVGDYKIYENNPPKNQKLIERWDGTSWATVISPTPQAEQSNVLNAVTCVSASDCWAVGYYYAAIAYQTLIERWNGTSWAIVPSPNNGTTDNYLTDVTCVSASDCWAVGRSLISGNASQTLIERWDGISWAIVTSPNTSADQTNALTSVTCASSSDCWAVGAYGNNIGDGFAQTLVERWNGTSWAIISSPNTSSTQHNVLYGVTCTSASNCWSAGFHDTGQFFGSIYQTGPDQTLVERWDGISWTIVSSPNVNGVATQDNVFNSITCASASDCWAVGYYRNGSNGQILIERWDGTSWALVPLPSVTQVGELAGVTCTSASDCWAVGDSYNGTNVQTLIERWDGTSWSTFTSPNASGPNNNRLGGVTCVSASDCWTVGLYTAADGLHPSHTLAEHYTAPLPFALVSAVSTKMHGSLGPFNIDLPLTGTRGIECRSGGANGDYSIVLTFTNSLMSVVSASTSCGSVSSSMTDSSDAHRYIVNLTGVTGACNAQYLTITLTGVLDNQGNTLTSATATMGVLLGDTTGDGSVNSSDISQTKAQSGQVTTSSNFRTDVTVNGLVNSSDISIVKSKSGTALP